VHYCQICQHPLGDHLHVVNDNPEPIAIPHDDVLARPSSVVRMAMVYKRKSEDDGTGRRKILDFVAKHLNNHKAVVLHKGKKVRVDEVEVDEIFRTDEDPSERWLGRLIEFSVKPPRQRAQGRVIPRLTLLWLALAIHNPAQAELVVR
jgi:hypothetical protein